MTRDQLLEIAREPRVAAFLQVIRFCEGTLGDRGYQTIFGYRFFTSFADHPRQRIPFGSGYTTAAVRQFSIRVVGAASASTPSPWTAVLKGR